MSIIPSMRNNWAYTTFPERIDAFNFPDLKEACRSLAQGSKLVALDMSETRFISLPAIKYIHVFATEVVKNGGRVTLLAPTEKIKRQIDIFAKLDPMTIFPSIHAWEVSNGWKKDNKKVVKVGIVADMPL